MGEINAILMHIGVRYSFKDFDEDFLTQKINECNKITSYMSNTISDFQNFFKPSKSKVVFEVNDACERASAILQASLKFHLIRFHFEQSEPSAILGYPNEFAQAILNILSNAKDVLIEFLATGYKKVSDRKEVRTGGVKDKLLPTVWGVGIVGDKYPRKVDGKHTEQYSIWRGLYKRCYDEKFHKNNITYVEGEVVSKFVYYDKFFDW